MTIPKRNIRKDYERAYKERHAALVLGGNLEEAEKVAAILKEHYGVDVEKTDSGDTGADLENASDSTANETTAARTTTPAKKAAAAKPSTSK